MNYLEFDQEMTEIFKRISGFYLKGGSMTEFEEKNCEFLVKEYQQNKKGQRQPDPKIIGVKQYNMSKHIDTSLTMTENDSFDEDFEDP